MRKWVAVAVVVLAIVVGFVLWRHHDETSSSTPPATPHVVAPRARNAKDPATGAPLWFAQRGVAPRRIAGTVMGDDGQPVSGATVRLVSRPSSSGLIAEPRAKTDATGHFDLGTQLGAVYTLVAEAPRWTGATIMVDARDPTLRTDDLHVLLHACVASIYGTVRDAAGGVVPRARISWSYGMSTRGGIGVEAADDGTYELCTPVGDSIAIAMADGYATISDPVSAFGRVRHDWSLVPEATVVGRVVRARDRSPVGGAIIELGPGERSTNVPTLYASTGDDGRFHLEGVTPGRHEVVARADGLSTTRPVDVIALIGASPEEVICVVEETFTISGKVVAHGTPVAGAAVRMTAALSHDAVTQPDGTFMIEHALPGEYTPAVRYYKLAQTNSVKVETTDVAGVVLDVEELASISGRVTHDGKPVDGARVIAGPSNRAIGSEHDGRYTLRGLEPGTYTMYGESQRAGAFTKGQMVTLAKSEQKTGVDIELDLAGSVAGVVVDQHDAPVPGVQVRFSLLRGNDFGVATTGEDGTFTARAMSGGGDYVYEVRPNNDSRETFKPVDGKRFPPVAVRDGQTHVDGLRIKIRVERASIGGRVIDGAGKPVPNIAIRAERASSFRLGQLTASTDANGAFTIRDLLAGTYHLHANDTTVTDIATGRTDVVIKLPELGALEGTLDGFTGTVEVLAFHMEGSRHSVDITGTTFRARNLPVGKYRIVAQSPSGSDTADVTISPGTPTKVLLRARGFGTVVGTLLDEQTRAPVPSVDCGLDVLQLTRPAGVVTDDKGAFRFDRVPEGKVTVWCDGGSATVQVVAGQTARVDVVERARPRVHAESGLVLEDQLSDVMVKALAANGPAQRAGIAVGDVVVEVDGSPVTGMRARMTLDWIEERPAGSTIKLAIERGDKRLTMSLTLEAAR